MKYKLAGLSGCPFVCILALYTPVTLSLPDTKHCRNRSAQVQVKESLHTQSSYSQPNSEFFFFDDIIGFVDADGINHFLVVHEAFPLSAITDTVEKIDDKPH